MKKTRFGLWLFPAMVSRAGGAVGIEAPHLVLEAVRLAEQLHFDEVWLGDEGPSGWDPFVLGALALQMTQKIRIGIGIANPITRHPGTSALACATINAQFPGRVSLGFGCGGSMPLQPYGLRSARVADLQIAVETAKATLAGNVTETYAPPTPRVSAPEVGVYLGGRGPKVNTLASERADGAFLSGIGVDQLDEAIGWAHSHQPIDLVIMPVAPASEELNTLRILIEKYPGQCVGVSLTDDDPRESVARLGAALAQARNVPSGA
jgi:alkanesulfonate monooxygenase SsuD/methylene tetrahydromethanopterin reductase-like flavin-dependent oxidoreductase (luciferase family)